VIALPLTDTPMIRKNQELRQTMGGRRRSSLGMRGKRASSIGNGFIAQPHAEVSPVDFYKHIAADLPEPVRMKQLLSWCGRRVLDEQKASVKPENANAAAIARVIQEELLKDLVDNKVTTSWYHRSDDQPSPTRRKPHPQNVENKRKIKDCENRLAQLRTERDTWSAMIELHPEQSGQVQEDRIALDESCLRPEDTGLLNWLRQRPDSLAKENERLGAAEGGIEFKVDRLFHSLHTMQIFGEVADRYGSAVLKEAAQTLDKRDRMARERAGSTTLPAREVLRSIARADM